DKPLYNAYDDILRAAADDADAGQLNEDQFAAVAHALGEAYDERVNSQQSDYHEILARPVAQAYVIHFLAAHISLSGNRSDMKVAPYDASLRDQADRGVTAATDKCRARDKQAANEAARIECYVELNRNFAITIGLRDMNLFD